MPLKNGQHVSLITEYQMLQPLEIIIIDKDTINNKKTFPRLSIPNTEITKGAHAKGGTGYIIQLMDQKILLQIYLIP